MTAERILTYSQIEELWQEYEDFEDFACAIEQAVLQSEKVQAWKRRVETLEKIVAECRDAMPIPSVGSKAEKCWPDAMSDAEGVPGFVKASIEAVKRDAERYRWLRTDDIGTEVVVEDMFESALCNEDLDAAIDAAMGKQP